MAGLRYTPGVQGGFMSKAQESFGQAGQLFSQQKPTMTQNPPGKTAGGALSSAAGMAVAGGTVGGPPGAIAGAAVGFMAYMLS